MLHKFLVMTSNTTNSSLFDSADVASTTEAGAQTAAGSMSSVRSKNFLENSVDWTPVVKKYRSLIESPGDD